jgi:hypothetical protein
MLNVGGAEKTRRRTASSRRVELEGGCVSGGHLQESLARRLAPFISYGATRGSSHTVLGARATRKEATIPLLEIFRRLTARRREHLLLLGLVGAGYLATWAAFGVVVFAASRLLRAGVNDIAISPRGASAALVFVAGAFHEMDS